ncbi:hypothetical protein GD3902_11670 [Geobacillus thermodenitrificans]|nr:hypothetical protein GD3902_11670 [Geobacillus thermodenitrificans]
MTDCFVLDKVMMMSWDMLKQRVTRLGGVFISIKFQGNGKAMLFYVQTVPPRNISIKKNAFLTAFWSILL